MHEPDAVQTEPTDPDGPIDVLLVFLAGAAAGAAGTLFAGCVAYLIYSL